jgi:cobalt-zinc-cadmium efflux system protein
LWNVVRRLRSTILLFLQGSPDDIDQNAIETEILDLDLTENIHHTHIWSLDGEHHVFSTHIRLKKLDNLAQLSQFKEDINEVLSKYRFEHITVDTELNEENCHSEHSDPTQF